MSNNIINCKDLALSIISKLNDEISNTASLKRKPCLLLIGIEDQQSQKAYFKSCEKVAKEAGICIETCYFPESVSAHDYLGYITMANQDPNIDGILIGKPLPKHIQQHHPEQFIDVDKDVEGVNPVNMGKAVLGKLEHLPCTVSAVLYGIDSIVDQPKGMHAVIIGSSNIVGKPLAMQLIEKGITTTLCNEHTSDLYEHTLQADILISATGVPELIKADNIKAGCIVFDVGVTKAENGKLLGDIDFDSVKNVASWITPVPNGVGQMTTAFLMQQVVDQWKNHL